MPRKKLDSNTVNPEIKTMTGDTSEEAMLASLPQPGDTAAPQPERVRKPRRTKAEMEAARGEQVLDPRIERFNNKASAFGLDELHSAGFMLSGKPLEPEEKKDLGDVFYAMSQKGGLGRPSESWFAMLVIYITMMLRYIFVRTEMGDQVFKWIKELFEKPKEQEKQPEEKKE